jgi:hypothetical protein
MVHKKGKGMKVAVNVLFMLLILSCAVGCTSGTTQGKDPAQRGAVTFDTNTGAASDATLRVVIANNQTVTDPCEGTLTKLISGSVMADTELIPPATGKRYYCYIALDVGGTADETVSIVESTMGGGTCTVNPEVVVGSKVDAQGWRLSNTNGFLAPKLLVGPLMNAATCLKVATGNLRVSYVITYVQQ